MAWLACCLNCSFFAKTCFIIFEYKFLEHPQFIIFSAIFIKIRLNFTNLIVSYYTLNPRKSLLHTSVWGTCFCCCDWSSFVEQKFCHRKSENCGKPAPSRLRKKWFLAIHINFSKLIWIKYVEVRRPSW